MEDEQLEGLWMGVGGTTHGWIYGWVMSNEVEFQESILKIHGVYQ